MAELSVEQAKTVAKPTSTTVSFDETGLKGRRPAGLSEASTLPSDDHLREIMLEGSAAD